MFGPLFWILVLALFDIGLLTSGGSTKFVLYLSISTFGLLTFDLLFVTVPFDYSSYLALALWSSTNDITGQ